MCVMGARVFDDMLGVSEWCDKYRYKLDIQTQFILIIRCRKPYSHFILTEYRLVQCHLCSYIEIQSLIHIYPLMGKMFDTLS